MTVPDDPVAPVGEPPDGAGEARGQGTAPPGRQNGRHRRTRHPWRLAVAGILTLIIVVLVGGALWVHAEAGASGPVGRQVIVTVPAGSGSGQLAADLQSKGVISSSLAYRLWSLVHSSPALEPGTYAFRQNVSFSAVDQILGGGPNVFPLVVPPGFTVAEVGERIDQIPGHDQATFDAVATSGKVRSPWQPAGSTNLDGLLGTGTYLVVPGQSDEQLLTTMVDRFNAQADALGLASGAAALGLTPYQVVTVASIVEKEGVIAKNLGPVARVILNRLSRGMPLQMDSTVLYAEGRDGGTVTSSDLDHRSPYNTYLNTGLTPTPICFPSPAALRAALHPPAGSWLYFVVVDQDGTEAFVDTYAQQLANEDLARQRGLP